MKNDWRPTEPPKDYAPAIRRMAAERRAKERRAKAIKEMGLALILIGVCLLIGRGITELMDWIVVW